RFVDRRSEVECEVAPLLLDASLDDLPEAVRDRGLPALCIAEVRVEVAETELPIGPEHRRRHRLDASLPRERRQTEAEESEPNTRRPLGAHADATRRGTETEIAERQKAATTARAPEKRRAVGLGAHLARHGRLEQPVVDDQGK